MKRNNHLGMYVKNLLTDALLTKKFRICLENTMLFSFSSQEAVGTFLTDKEYLDIYPGFHQYIDTVSINLKI